jgi:hypothetical protein
VKDLDLKLTCSKAGTGLGMWSLFHAPLLRRNKLMIRGSGRANFEIINRSLGGSLGNSVKEVRSRVSILELLISVSGKFYVILFPRCGRDIKNKEQFW